MNNLTQPSLSDPTDAPLIPTQRREAILRQLRRVEVLSVNQLMEMFDCSHMTVRRDIAALEQAGLVYSVPGGVRMASRATSELSHSRKVLVDQEEKQAIAFSAAPLLHSGLAAYLDAGTTTLALVPYILALSDMTVVTNDFAIVQAFVDAPHVNVIHTGGLLDHANRSSVGSLAAVLLSHIAIDISFISASSWDLKRGVTTPSPPKVDVKRAAMAAASKTVLLASSAKYGTFGLYRIAGLEQFDHIITDHGLTDAAAEGIRQTGLDLTLASTDLVRSPSRV